MYCVYCTKPNKEEKNTQKILNSTKEDTKYGHHYQKPSFTSFLNGWKTFSSSAGRTY